MIHMLEYSRKYCRKYKVENINATVFNMITGINELKILKRHISSDFRYKFDCKKCNSKQKMKNGKCQWGCKEPVKRCVCKENCICNPSICASECDKECGVDEYLKNCTYMKSQSY